jgi:hypothetical protein
MALAALTMVCSAAVTPSALSQSSSDTGKTVVILGVQRFEDADLRARIVLNRHSRIAGVIAVPRGTVTRTDLAEAFHILHEMRKEADSLPRRASMMRTDLRKVPRRTLSDAESQAYGRYISAFARAPEVEVPGVGKGLAVQVALPAWPD